MIICKTRKGLMKHYFSIKIFFLFFFFTIFFYYLFYKKKKMHFCLNVETLPKFIWIKILVDSGLTLKDQMKMRELNKSFKQLLEFEKFYDRIWEKCKPKGFDEEKLFQKEDRTAKDLLEHYFHYKKYKCVTHSMAGHNIRQSPSFSGKVLTVIKNGDFIWCMGRVKKKIKKKKKN